MIFVLGCDGYLGNALAQRLISRGYDVVGIDNFWRRHWIRDEMNSHSATPIMKMDDKIRRFNESDADNHFEFHNLDVLDEDVEELFEHYKPEAVFNLAHNPSAPFSMKSRSIANEVLINC